MLCIYFVFTIYYHTSHNNHSPAFSFDLHCKLLTIYKRYHLILFCLDLNSVWCVFDAINETDKQIISCGLHSQDNWTVSGWNVTVTRHRTVDIYIYIFTDSCKHRPQNHNPRFLTNNYNGFKSPTHVCISYMIHSSAVKRSIGEVVLIHTALYNPNMWSPVLSLLFPRT